MSDEMEQKVKSLRSELSLVVTYLDWFLDGKEYDADGLPISRLEMLAKVRAMICDSKERMKSSLAVLEFLDESSKQAYDVEYSERQKNFLDGFL